jgi:hypothetical protein
MQLPWTDGSSIMYSTIVPLVDKVGFEGEGEARGRSKVRERRVEEVKEWARD